MCSSGAGSNSGLGLIKTGTEEGEEKEIISSIMVWRARIRSILRSYTPRMLLDKENSSCGGSKKSETNLREIEEQEKKKRWMDVKYMDS